MYMRMKQHVMQHLQSACHGFLAGYVDTLGFIAIFGVFITHVTGNFVLIGSALAHPAPGMLIKFAVFPVFIVSIAFTRLFILWLERRHQPALFYTWLLQLVLLAGFTFCGYSASPFIDPHAPLALLAVVLGTAAMAVQTAAGRILLPASPPGTVITGNVTQLVIHFVDRMRAVDDPDLSQKLWKFFWPVAGFGAGTVAAAFIWNVLGFLALLLPCLIIVWLACTAWPGTAR